MTDDKNKLHSFIQSDQPVQAIDEDVLDRAGFAESIAQAVAEWDGEECLIIGVQGPWGSGKSSLKNFIHKHLIAIAKAQGEKPIHVHNFSPWEWLDTTTVQKALFSELRKFLKRKDLADQHKKAAEQLKKYSDLLELKGVSDSGTALGSSLATLAASLGLSSLVASDEWKTALQWGTGIFAVLAFIAAGLKVGSGVRGLLADRHQKTLSEQNADLRTAMSDLPRPIVFFVDEIDRLNGQELRSLFTTLKANANLPNLVFVLFYDARIVEQELQQVIAGSPRTYLEKLIQMQFTVPNVDEYVMGNLLYAGIGEIFDSPAARARFNLADEANHLHELTKHFVRDLRQVKRYQASLNFHARMFDGEVYEANPKDLILLEILRMFEPQVYEKVAQARRLTIGGNRLDLHEKDLREIVEDIISVSSKRQPVSDILQSLFPNQNIEHVNGFWSGANQDAGRLYKDARVCHDEIFPRYFQFGITGETFPFSKLAAFLRRAVRREGALEALDEYEKAGQLTPLMKALDQYKLDIPRENYVPLLSAFMDYVDSMEDDRGRAFFTSQVARAERIFYWIFRDKISSPPDQDAVFREALSQSKGIVLSHRLAKLLQGDGDHPRLISVDVAAEENAEFLRRIRLKADSGELLKTTNLLWLLFRWRDAGSEAEVISWVKQVASQRATWAILISQFITATGINDKYFEHYSPEADETFLKRSEAQQLWASFRAQDPTEFEQKILQKLAVKMHHRNWRSTLGDVSDEN